MLSTTGHRGKGVKRISKGKKKKEEGGRREKRREVKGKKR